MLRIDWQGTVTLGCILIAGLVLQACTGEVTRKGDTVTSKALPAGFQCLLTPTQHNSPGTIMRIDPQGTTYTAGRLNVQPMPGSIAVGSAYATSDSSAQVVTNLVLDKYVPGLNADIAAKALAKSNRRVEFDATSHEILFDDVRIQAIEYVKNLGANAAPGNYYLIREAVYADKVNYELTESASRELNVDAQLEQLAKVNAGVKRATAGGYTLTTELNPALPVCIKPEQIRPKTNALGEYEVVTVTERLPVK